MARFTPFQQLLDRQQDPGKVPRCLRHLVSAENFYGCRTPGTLQMIQSGASRAACQSMKRSSHSEWGFLGTRLNQLQNRTTIVSSPPPCDHRLIGGELVVVQDPPGWEWQMRTFSPRTLGSTRHGGRQRTGMLGIKSSVWQRSVRSSPLRRRTAIVQLNLD